MAWRVEEGRWDDVDLAGLCGGELVIGKMRSQHDVGINSQCGGKRFRDGRAGEAEMAAADPLVPLQPEIIEGVRERLVIERPCPAHDPIRHQRRASLLLGGIVDATGRDQERKGGRLHVLHRLDDQRQAAGIRVRKDLLLIHAGSYTTENSAAECSTAR